MLVIIYAAMGAAAIVVLRSMARRWRQTGEIDLPTPYTIDATGVPPRRPEHSLAEPLVDREVA